MKQYNPDYILLITIGILVVFGLVMLYSASIVKGQEDFNQPYFYFKHQLIFGFLAGAFFAFIAYKINYRFWKKIAFLLIVATIILLVLIFLPGLGIKSGGATRWLSLGAFSLQPAEITKLALIIYLAAWLEERTKSVRDIGEVFVPFLVTTGLIIVLITLQPNLGTAGVIGLIAVVIFFCAGAGVRQLLLK